MNVQLDDCFILILVLITMITIEQLIIQIEKRQPVINKESLSSKRHRLELLGVGSLSEATVRQISILANPQYLTALTTSQAGVILVTESYADKVSSQSVAIIVANPYLAYASVSQLFADDGPLKNSSIHPSAVIADNAVIGEYVRIGPFCVIGEHVRIGAYSCLDSHIVIESNSSLGSHCVVKSHVTIGHDCSLGNDVRLHAGVSIGAEGFGFAPTEDRSVSGWERIAQLGRVIIGNNVRIGSQTCVDRGAIDDTVIGNHVIIDNLVQIAHNVRIGDGTAIAAQTGIAGSTTIGKRCIIGGAVGITGHIEITDDVTLSAMTMVTKSITTSGPYSSGTAAMPTADWRRAAVRFRQLGRK